MTRADSVRLGAIVGVFALLALVIPPARDFPIADDWSYAASVTDWLRGRFPIHDFAQAASVGLVGWGTLFALLFGNTFTVLTVATIFLGVGAASLFYLLARELGVLSAPALLGTAALCLNPIFLFLTRSFMTDMAFMVLMLGGVLLFVRGTRAESRAWVWLALGGVVVGVGYLTRQFGLLVVPGALAVLWARGRLGWREATAVLAGPLLSILIYAWWEGTHPPRMIEYATGEVYRVAREEPLLFALDRAERVAVSLSWLGLSLAPALVMGAWSWRRVLQFGGLLLGLVLFAGWSAQRYGSFFPQNGNVLNGSGLHNYGNYARTVWSESVWTLIALAGLAALALYIVGLAGSTATKARENGAGGWRSALSDPAWVLYGASLLTGAASIVATPQFFDRYLLPLLPGLLLPVLRRLGRAGEAGRARIVPWRWSLVAILGLFAAFTLRDYMDHARARWWAAEYLARSGLERRQVDAGFEVSNYFLYESGAAQIRASGDYSDAYFPPAAILDPEYVISDVELPGHRMVQGFPYRSWLEGGVERVVLVLRRE